MSDDTSTPWGEPLDIDWSKRGLVWVETAGHGGFILSEELFAEMPFPFREFPSWNGPRFWEEDCDAFVVVAAFPQLFRHEQIANACRVIRSYAKYDDDFAALLDHLPDCEVTA